MHETTSAGRIMWKLAPSASGVVLFFLWTIAVCGQSTTARGKGEASYPRLPGAVTRAPAWAGADDPFDIARFFAPVPRERNAAPLYLDGLFEFDSGMEICFREGPDRTRRSPASKDRSKRYGDLIQPTFADPKLELDADAVDSFDQALRRRLSKAGRSPAP